MFANNLNLCRHILRRDRLSIIFWICGLVVLVVGFAGAITDMYPDQASLSVMGETLKMPSMVIMLGPVYSNGELTVGALYANFMLLWTAVIIAIMNIFLVSRHTRQDEEEGRSELIISLPVGRMSGLSLVMIIALVENLTLAILFGFGISLLRIESMPFGSSLLFGFGLGATGLIFAASTAVICQLSASNSAATGLGFGFLGIMYFIRAVGDLYDSELIACVSPLGLLSRIKVFADNEWLPILILMGIAVALTALAFFLRSLRDVGAGLIPLRKGRAGASKYLISAPSLALRLLKTPFIIWSALVLFLGIAYGSVMGSLEEFLATNEFFKQILPNSDPVQFISFLNVIMSFIATIPAMHFVLRVRDEEKRGYAENILVNSVSRREQLRGYLSIAVMASIFMQFLSAFGFYVGSVSILEARISIGTYFGASMVYIPAQCFMISVSILIYAIWPRYTSLAWLYLGYGFGYSYIGVIMKLPEWLGAFTPFYYIPKLPIEEFRVLPFLILAIMSAALILVSFVLYRKRDMIFN